jgi:cephalosporin hydroxylase
MIDLRDIAMHTGASQDKFEFWRILEVLASRPPKIVVEIGVDTGYYLKSIREAFNPELMIGMDNSWDRNEYKPGKDTYVGMNYNSRSSSALEALKGILAGRPIDFLFIDGDHTYGGVKSDWEMYSPLVRKGGGVVGFHDTRRIGDKWKNHVEVYPIFRQLQTEYPSAEFWNGPLGEGAPGTGLIFV